MLIIEDKEVNEALSMKRCIEAMEQAFGEQSKGMAYSHPRQRYKVPVDPNEPGYFANMIAGAVPSLGVAALRSNSIITQEKVVNDLCRLEFGYPDGRSWGFVILYSLKTGRPLAMIQDFTLSALRVGATTGVALRYLSREDSRTIGLFGSGNEARRNLEAACSVRQIDKCRVFSPNKSHRESFAAEMSQKLGIDVQGVDRAEDAVLGSDIVLCMTNSSQPVFNGELLVPGQTVVTIANSDHVHRRSEVDSSTMIRSALIAINSRATAIDNNQRELLDLIDENHITWDKVHELGNIINDPKLGRTRPDQLIYYKANAGMGIQFAAAGAVIYETCKELKRGHELPDEWFGASVQEWLDKGFQPSP